MKKRIILLAFLCLAFLAEVSAQCVMCKAVAESSNKPFWEKGINSGILYMAAFPYMLLGVVGYIIYRNYKKAKNGKKVKN